MNVVPEAVREAARRAFDEASSEVTVADLVFDSLLDADGSHLADGGPGRRTLRFGDRDAGASLSAADRGDVVAVELQVLPPVAATVEIRSKGPTFTVRTDDNGGVRFDVRPGLVSLVIRPVRAMWHRPLQTAWVRL